MDNKIRNILLALMIILFIYFEIHSCSEDTILLPESTSQELESTVYNANDVFFLDTENGWIVGQSGTVARTNDGGESWVPSVVDSVELLSVFFVDKDQGWIVGRNGTVLNSRDGGREWTRATFNGFPEDDDLYRVKFLNESTGFVLGHKGIYRTSDGGANWQNNWVPVDPYRGAWDMSVIDEHNIYLLGTRWNEPDPEVLYRSVDGGLTWNVVEGTNVSKLRGILTIYFVDGTTGWGGGGAVLKTEDGGSSWISQVGIAEVRRLYFKDEMNGLAVGNSKLIITEDGGNTWADILSGDERITDLRSIFFIDQVNGWVVGRGIEEEIEGEGSTCNYSVLMRTRDGGENWTVKYLPWIVD